MIRRLPRAAARAAARVARRPAARATAAWIATLAAGLALATAPARAGEYWVSPGGSANNSGTSPGSPWSLAKANATLAAGDVCRLLPGSYSGSIAPAGSGASNASRITFIGNPADPASVRLSGSIDLTSQKYVTIKGVQVNDIAVGALSASNRCEQDSVLDCRATGSLWVAGALRCHFARNRIGDGAGEDRWNIYKDPIRTTLCTFRDNVATLGGVTAQPHCILFDRATACEFTGNSVSVTMPSNAADVHARVHYGVNNCIFRDNRWSLVNNTSYNCYIFNQRDSCRFNLFERDTVLDLPSGRTPSFIRFATAGSYPGSNGHNTFVGCLFKSRMTMDYQNDTRGDRWFGCVLVSPDRAFDFSQVFSNNDSLTVQHCTFASTGGTAVDAAKNSHLAFVSNIVYSAASACPAMFLPTAARTDSNLVFEVGGSAGNAVSQGGSGCGPVGPGSSWCASSGNECHSAWASPAFADPGFATFDAHPLPGSAAVGAAWKDGYVGAYAPVVPDEIPPAAVRDLALQRILDQSVVLSWTATGNDGALGVAAAYDLRWSTQPINDQNFAGATPVPVAPQPLPAGQEQTYVLLGLAPGTTYSFALKARDAAGNWSALSNVAGGTTDSSDRTAPAPVQDLSEAP
ncbi:MAG: hypothetical protein A2W00_02330 [Candidatus Eisenbacteria bacterium RBG_16_71_46]|nr:MAG: hypothetical protein A2W00_02330 [Candidatus Eisenbacteria bacterium RBG_16_71_46]